jgi:phospholipid/cholesterol/gamma-HCH transport system substrate-binding protein
MNEQALRFRLGVFVLFALVLLGVLVLLFGGFPTLLRSHRTYVVDLPNAAGLAPGTPVRRSGVRIGEVERVDLDEQTGVVRVTIAIEDRHVIQRDDRPTLVHGLLGGDTSIDFVPQHPGDVTADHSPVPAGTELKGQSQADAAKLMSQTSETIPEVRQTNAEIRELARAWREMLPDLKRTNDEIRLTSQNWGRLGERLDVLLRTNEEKLVKTLDNFNDTVTRLGATFNEENQRNLSVALRNVRAGTENLESLTHNTDELMKESRQTMKRVNESITRTDEVLTNLQRATKPWADRGDPLMRNLEESSDKLNRTLGDLQAILRAVAQRDGTLQRFVADPALYNNLNDAACMLTRVLPRLDRILHDLEIFSDKIARHPETLGVRGAVAPSSGLKEAPSAYPSWPPGH